MPIATVSRLSLQRSLEERLDAALQGQVSICVVTGEAGSGKTHLIQQFARTAQSSREDLLVAYSACNAVTGIADAYMPFREILQHLSGDIEESLAEGNARIGNASRLRRFMQTSARSIIENGPDLVDVFVPGGALLTRLSGKVARRWAWFDQLANRVNSERPKHVSAEIRQDNIFEQYTRVIEAMSAEAPLLLIVDDLHWADSASLGLLFQLARRLVNNKVLIIAATRNPDESPDTQELNKVIHELRRYFGEINLDLANEPEDKFANSYLDAIGVHLDQEFIDSLVKKTGGNPLFVVELLRQSTPDDDARNNLGTTWAGELPSRLTGVLERQYGTLDAHERQILATASVQGYEFWAELIADIHGDTPLNVVRLLGGTLQRDRQIIIDAGPLELVSGIVSRFRFRHDLLREFAYQSLTENERRTLHKAVAEQIEGRTRESAETYCLLLADQFQKACDWKKALRYRVMAAEKTESASAPIEAASHYSAAIDICGRMSPVPTESLFDLQLRLATQLSLSGDFSKADQIARAALDSATAANHSSIAWLAVGRIARQCRDHIKALHALEQAEAAFPSADESDDKHRLRIDLLLERAVVHYFQRDSESLGETNRALAELIDAHGEPHQQVSYFSSRSRQALADCSFSPGSDAILFSQKAIDSAQPPTANSIFGLAFAKLWQEQFDECIELLEKARSEATRHGDSAVRLQALLYLSVAQRRLGNVEAVDQLVEQIAAALEYVTVPEYPSVLSAQKAWLAYRRGDNANAMSYAQSASRAWLDENSAYPFRWIAEWVRFAVVTPGSDDALSAARSMLSSKQAWQRESVIETLEAYVGKNDAADEYHAKAVAAAVRESYL